MRGIDAQGIEWACHADEAGAHPQRTASCKPCGPRRVRWTAHDDRVAARIFVSVRPRPGKDGTPQPSFVLERRWIDRFEHLLGNSDIGDACLPAKKASRHQHVAW